MLPCKILECHDMDCFSPCLTDWLWEKQLKRFHTFMKRMITANTSGMCQCLGNCTHCSVTNHTKSISSELYLMHIKRSWTCLWLRTINEKAHTGALRCLLPAPPLITAYVTSWPPHALIRLLYARRVRTLPLPVHTYSLTLWLRLWIVWSMCVEVKLRVLLVLSKAVKALCFSFCSALHNKYLHIRAYLSSCTCWQVIFY